MQFVFSTSNEDRKKTLINLQWLIVLATSYLLLFQKGEVVSDPRAFSLILVLLATVPVLYRLPTRHFDHRLFAPTLVILDTLLICAGITLNRQSPWDLLLVFFFGLFIAATGESLIKIIAGCVLISVVSLMANPFSSVSLPQLDADMLFRIPFLFGVSILYGYLAEQTRREKEKAKKTEETAQLKRQMVSALAHDIKNPFAVIMGYAEFAVQDLKEGHGTQGILDALQRIQDNAERVVKLISGFLDASRIESGTVEVAQQPVQLNLLAREVGQQQVMQMIKKDLSLLVELDEQLPDITGDPAQIDRVLWNLVGNAIKFTPKGGEIIIKSWQENGHVCASVRDTGIGISKEDLASLFAEFRRLKSAAKVDGTGLGLFIAKNIVEAHGGTIGAESEEGKGSTFTVRFPARK